MNKLFTLLLLVLFLFFSENALSQSIKISEKRAKNQIVNGIKVTPLSKKVKAIPVSIILQSSNNKLIEKKAHSKKEGKEINITSIKKG